MRNPYARIASAWLDKIARDRPAKYAVSRRLGRGFHAPVSFADFCRYLQDDEGWGDDYHWVRQSDLIPCPVESLDFIGRVETLETDLELLTTRLFGQACERHDALRHGTKADSKLRDLYTDREMAAVAEVYAEDFRAFGYDPDRLPGRSRI